MSTKTKKLLDVQNVTVVNFSAKYGSAFKKLNSEWIKAYFKMEKHDFEVLNNPQKYIIDKGGYILIALYKDKPVGVCALIKMEDSIYDYELAKMAVSPAERGKGIGLVLGKAAIEKAKLLGAKKIYLGSNTKLTPAIKLYKKLGFHKIKPTHTPYERCNYQMELILVD